MIFEHMAILLPELIIGIGSLILLLLSVFFKKDTLQFVTNAALIILTGVLVSITVGTFPPGTFFYDQLVCNSFIVVVKILLIILGILVTFISRHFLKKDGIEVSEYSILVLLAVLGMLIMVSANSFLSLFMGLELQSLSLYILTAIRRDDAKASEAAVKYFLLGSLATGIMLYGITFIYGTVGSVNFPEIKLFLGNSPASPLAFYMGMIFVLVGVLFKVSVAPFHMWAPDVYEGAPATVVSFFASVPKIAAFCMLIRLLSEPFFHAHLQWQSILAVLSVISMVIGALGALTQSNIKRLLGYSSILNMGYALLGVLPATNSGIEAALVYIILYAFTILGFFMCLLHASRRGYELQNLSDLAGLFRISPSLAFSMVFLLFSFAGIPPLAGFVGKLYVFKAALQADLIVVALIGVITSVIAAAYYLYLIKIIVIDEPALSVLKLPQGGEVSDTSSMVLIGIVIGTLSWFFIRPEFFLKLISKASQGVFPG